MEKKNITINPKEEVTFHNQVDYFNFTYLDMVMDS